MQEILPGIFHWTQEHPKIKIHVSSYFFEPEHVLTDPLIPDEGLEWFAKSPPENIYLSLRHHYRHCAEFEQRFGVVSFGVLRKCDATITEALQRLGQVVPAVCTNIMQVVKIQL